jgi:rhamnogalacturonyl hydrolase YesR
MFVYSLLKAVRLGYVKDSDGKIVASAKKTYGYMTKNWVKPKTDGTFDWINTVQVGSLSGVGDYDVSLNFVVFEFDLTESLLQYYVGVPTVTNDVKGLAAFLLASVEYERL